MYGEISLAECTWSYIKTKETWKWFEIVCWNKSQVSTYNTHVTEAISWMFEITNTFVRNSLIVTQSFTHTFSEYCLNPFGAVSQVYEGEQESCPLPPEEMDVQW